MKNALIVTLAALLGASALVAGPATAHATLCVRGNHCYWGEHHDVASARIAITSEDGKVTMLLTDRDLALQLSDRTIHKVRRELREKKHEQDNWFAYAIVAAVVGTVQGVLDNSLEVRLRDLRDVRYEDGRVQIIGRNGRRLFRKAECDGEDVLSRFSEADAKEFVREFRKLKGI